MPRPCPRNEAHARRLGVEWRGPDGLTWIERRWGVRNTNPESRVNLTDSGGQGAEDGDRVESGVVAAGSAEVVVPESSGIDSEGGGSGSGPDESPRRSTRSGRGVKRRREGPSEVVVPGSSGIDGEQGGGDSPGESPRRSTRSGRGVKRRREAVCDEEEGSKVTSKTASESVSAGKTCRFCKKVLSSSSYREKHEKTVHMGVKDYQCPLCNKTFGRKEARDKHEKTVHKGVKDYHCHWCKKAFGEKSSRDVHEKTVHMGVKDYHCHWCNKAFGEKGSRNRHEKTVHKGIKDFDCERCGKKFGRRSILSRHMKSSACQ